MKRREFIGRSAALAALAALPELGCGKSKVSADSAGAGQKTAAAPAANPLKDPVKGKIPVAFVISQGPL